MFNRVFFVVFALALMLQALSGCCNIGCKYDLRKYPTPIASPAHTPVHLWNPECNSSTDLFDKLLPPGYNAPQAAPVAPKPLPVGPVKATAELQAPNWSDPLRGGAPVSTTGNAQ